jgi:hypothetical protein
MKGWLFCREIPARPSPVVRQFVVPDRKRISFCLAQALRFGIRGRFVDGRKMLAENVNRALAGSQAMGGVYRGIAVP